MHDFLKELFTWICLHADYAPYPLFFLLLLSGLLLPVSEDLVVILGGMIAAHCVDSEKFPLFLFFMLWSGVLLSAWETYWIGRILGPKIFSLPVIHSFIKPKHINRAEQLIAKYGIFSFIVVRFFPGGVRNALFLTSGLTKMPFILFVGRDSIAVSLTTTILFFIGYIFEANFDQIFGNFERIDKIFLIIVFLLIIYLIYRYKTKK